MSIDPKPGELWLMNGPNDGPERWAIGRIVTRDEALMEFDEDELPDDSSTWVPAVIVKSESGEHTSASIECWDPRVFVAKVASP